MNVDARQLTAADRDDVVAWIRDAGAMTLDEPGGALVLLHPDGTARAETDDWIVHDDLRGFSVCKAAAFEARYYSA